MLRYAALFDFLFLGQRQGHEKQRAAPWCVGDGERPPVRGGNLFRHREPQTVVPFFISGVGGIGFDAVETVENFLLLFVGNAAAVVLYADCNFFFVRALGDKEEHRAPAGRVRQGVMEENMTHLSYSAGIAGAKRQL